MLEEPTLEQRRKIVSRKFAAKNSKNAKMSPYFVKARNMPRHLQKYLEPRTKSMRAHNGPIPYLIRLLNEKSQN